jgi:3',5'-cyclic AMP phosphodiesterase CpdA
LNIRHLENENEINIPNCSEKNTFLPKFSPFHGRKLQVGLNITNETDADGNPLADALMGANDATKAFADLWFYSNPIFVYSTSAVKTAKFQIKQASDDLEEYIAPSTGQTQSKTLGSYDWTSSDLELGCESAGNKDPQLVGVRFAGINIPKNTTIKKAYLEFELDSKDKQTDPCDLTIVAEDSDNPVTFEEKNLVLSSRPKTSASIEWKIPSTAFTVVDSKYQTSDITALVQANVNRAGWTSGNAMAFYIKGTGLREVESFEGESTAAATLVVEYDMSDQEIIDMQAADEAAYLNSLPQINIIYTSDSHYGITRANFQGATNVDSKVVNAALVSQLNKMPSVVLPSDKGIAAGKTINAIEYVINSGDIANRQEKASNIQSATTSWAQFTTDYMNGLSLKNSLDKKAPILLLPGNHDVSNAIGYTKELAPAIDKTSMVNIYNLMMNPATPVTTENYNYTTNKVNYSKNIGGVHFMFVNMWPDETNRVWMENDLKTISATTPVVIFAHDQPNIETKHLHNPNGDGGVNATDKFENMVEEKSKDGLTVSAPSTTAQKGFASFVKAHPNIKAYFHGNENFNEYYVYKGPENDIALRTIRVDSPMKGNVSSTQENKLSYQLISLEPVSKNLTVRECLWNPTATNGAPVQWGASITFTLSKADSLVAVANSLTELNYTTPSWTQLKKAMVTASSAKDDASIAKLESAMKNLKPKDNPYNVVMSINGDPSSRMGFAWFNNAGVTGGKVEIVKGTSTDFSSPAFTVAATTTDVTNLNYSVGANNLSTLAGIENNLKKSYVSNKALATGLTPNTTYSFRVGKPGAWSETGTFTTAKNTKDAFSFVYTTDPQANTEEMFDISQKTTHAAHTMYPNANFWLSCGDLIETSGSTNSEWEYEQFFQTQQDIFLKKPTAYIIGNHDKSANKNFTYHFNTESVPFDQAKSTTPGSVYSFVYGDALFMSMSYEDYSAPGYLDDLAAWMRAQVTANPNTKWRIVNYHKTMYTGSGSHQSDADGKAVRDAMAPVFDELKIDLALQGHDHIYEVIGPLKNKALVTNSISNQITVTFDARANVTGKTGGTFNVINGTLYFLNNSAGKKKYEPRSEDQMKAVEAGLGLTNYFGMFTGRFGQTGNPTFSNITVSTDAIDVNTFEVNDSGVASPFDSFKIIKSIKTGNDKGLSMEDAINMYPNPVKDFANITFANPVKATVNVYNANGTIVKTERINGSTPIDLSRLSSGVYFMEVKSESAKYTVKFIKE